MNPVTNVASKKRVICAEYSRIQRATQLGVRREAETRFVDTAVPRNNAGHDLDHGICQRFVSADAWIW